MGSFFVKMEGIQWMAVIPRIYIFACLCIASISFLQCIEVSWPELHGEATCWVLRNYCYLPLALPPEVRWFFRPFLPSILLIHPKGSSRWLHLLSREVHDPFGETKLCALGLQAHQCLKMLISVWVGDMLWWGWVWPNDVKCVFCCLLCLLHILSDSKRWTYSNPPWCWCLARPTQPIPLHPGRDPGPPICLDGMATGPFIDSWIEMKEQKINEHHMTSIYISYISGSGEFILAPSYPLVTFGNYLV